MRQAIVTFKSMTPYSASRVLETERDPKEGPDVHEKRCWRERLNQGQDGVAFIPPMAFKKMLDVAASRFPQKIKGRGQATYTKHMVSGILVADPFPLKGITRANVKGEWLHVPSDGKPGGAKRVMKCFPIVHDWSGTVTYHVLDDTITKEVFEETLRQGFAFVGIGRFRPERGGYYGRAEVQKIAWK